MSLKFPEEIFNIRESKGEDFYKIMIVNTALKNYPYKEDFPWKVNINIDLKETTEPFKLPTGQEAEVLNAIEDEFTTLIKANSSYQFIGRITDFGHRELYFYIDDPKKVHDALQSLIDSNTSKREFEYEISKDVEWNEVNLFYNY